MRKVSMISVSLLTVVLLFLPRMASAGKVVFVSIDFPMAGVTETEAAGAPSGIIVGRYITADNVGHGFVLANGEFKSTAVPGATYTDVTWINARGTVVGNYNAPDGTHGGFELNNGVFTTIEYPGVETFAFYGISESGVIVGPVCACIWATADGYLYRHGKFSLFHYPGSMGTYPTMLINPDLIFGAYPDGKTHGYFMRAAGSGR